MNLRPHRLPTASAVLPAVVVVLGAAVLITYSVGQWRSMQVPSWDLAIFSQLAKAYAGLQAPIVPIKGEGFNLLGDHFHPVLILLAPVWWLAPSPLALLVVQDLLLAVSSWPLTRLAVRVLGPWAGTALGVVYVLSWGIQGAVAAQFHEIAFAVPMLAWATAAYVERRWWACALWCAPLVLVKEDLGLTVLMAGLAIALRAELDQRAGHGAHAGAERVVCPGAEQPVRVEPDRRTAHPRTTGAGRAWSRLRERAAALPPAQLGLGLAAFGVVSFVLTVLVLLPALSPSGTWEYGIGGNAGDGTGPSQASTGLLARLFTPEVKLQTLGMVAATAGVVGLRSPWIALVAPTLAWRLLSGKEFYWEWENWHYNAVLMPIALGALLDVLLRLKTARGRSRWMQAPVPVRYAVALAVAVPIVVSALTAGRLPLAETTREGWGREPARAAAAEQVMAVVEPGSTVETDLGLLAYLVPRTTVYWVGTAEVDTDYVVVDSRSPAWGGRPPADAPRWATDQSRSGAVYELVLSLDGYQVARRTG